MVASKDMSIDYNLIKYNKINLLKSAVIYGPNASGKTNLLKALPYVRNLVINSHNIQPGQTIDFRPFKLDKAFEDKPSSFEMVFEIEDIKYIYGFSLDRDKVHKEYLYYYPMGRPSVIFERDINSSELYRFTMDKKRQNEIKINTRDNMLYISRSANMNYERTSIVVKWFIEKVGAIISPDFSLANIEGYTKKVFEENANIKMNIKRLVSKADDGIIDIAIKKREISEDIFKHISKDIPQEIKEAVIEDFRSEVETIHEGLDNEGNKIKVAFKLFEESSGTRKMFNIAGPIIDVLSKGQLLVVDEFEANLHPQLVLYLVDVFNSLKYNRYGAQLIFATHNTNLLGTDVFRRDQIWFTEKREDQSTNLYSLYDYKVRKDENIQKGYLTGRYGAIPNLD
jgi:hypothetical protein